MQFPRVTIIIASYNYADYIEQAIHSALNQNYEGPLQVCVMDDGSTDGSWEIISQIKNDKLIALQQPNGGASSARNAAIDYTWNDTDMYAILDADDEYYPDKVSICVQKMMENPDQIGAVYTDYDVECTRRNIFYREFKEPYNGQGLKRKCIVHSGALINKKALETVKEKGGEYYDTRLHGPGDQEFIGCSEDYDLWLRISEKFIILHVPIALALVSETGKNQTSKVTPQTEQSMVNIMSEKMALRQCNTQ